MDCGDRREYDIYDEQRVREDRFMGCRPLGSCKMPLAYGPFEGMDFWEVHMGQTANYACNKFLFMIILLLRGKRRKIRIFQSEPQSSSLQFFV